MVDKLPPGGIPTTLSPLLDLSFLGEALPVNMKVEDIVPLYLEDRGLPVPRRVFYLEDKGMYLVADLHGEPPQIYFIDTNTNKMVGSVIYSFNNLPLHVPGDIIADICPHATATKFIEFSLLVVNNTNRTSYVVRLSVNPDRFKTPAQEAGISAYHLTVEDIVFYAELVPPGKPDEIAVAYTEKYLFIPGDFTDPNRPVPNQHHYWPEPNVEEIIPKLHKFFAIGIFNPQYCNLTCTVHGKYVVYLGSRITVHVTPFLSCPLDTQYMITMDESGMKHQYMLTGPLYNTLNFNEGTEGQPYITNPGIVDGRYLLCMEERKNRQLSLKTKAVTPPDAGPLREERPDTETDWAGGFVADVYYPKRKALVTLSVDDGGNPPKVTDIYYWYGHADAWESSAILEPVHREWFWRLIDVCQLNSVPFGQHLTKYWRATTLLNFSALDGVSTCLSVYGNHAAYVLKGQLIHLSIDYLVFYEDFPENYGRPQNSIYISGLLPSTPVTRKYIVRNESSNAIAKHIVLTLGTLPSTVALTIQDFPTELESKETAVFSITVTYTPEAGDPPVYHLDLPFTLTYYTVWRLAAGNLNNDNLPVLDAPLESELFLRNTLSFFEPYAEYRRKLKIDPLYQIQYTTQTSSSIGDVVVTDEDWTNTSVYINKTPHPGTYQQLTPEALTGLTNLPTSTYKCNLHITGPIQWTTTRQMSAHATVYTLYLTNQSNRYTYNAVVKLNQQLLPMHNNCGFLVVDYPEGNLIEPGHTVPVTIKWMCCYDPTGQIVNIEKTTAEVGNQNDFPQSVYGKSPIQIGELLFNIPAKGFTVSHTYLECFNGGDGVVPTTQVGPLQTTTLNAVSKYKAFLSSILSIPTTQIPTTTPWLCHTGQSYTTPTHPAPLPCPTEQNDLPDTINVQFAPNPAQVQNATTAHPYQLTPFNAQYAKDYVGSISYMGAEIEIETVKATRYSPLSYGAALRVRITPCTEIGDPLSVWKIVDIWQGVTNPIAVLAGVQEHVITRIVYCKNVWTDPLDVWVDLSRIDSAGYDVVDVNYPNGHRIAANGVLAIELKLSCKLTVPTVGYANVVYSCTFVPVFNTLQIV